MTDQVVGDLAERVGRDDGVGELFERFGVRVLDAVDEVVEADGLVILACSTMPSTLG